VHHHRANFTDIHFEELLNGIADFVLVRFRIDFERVLAGEFRKRNDFAASKGWIKGYHILSNINPRDGEPDLYLVTIFDHQTTPAEDIQREKELNAFMAQTTRQSAAGSGHRATYRKQKGDMLLQELVWSR